MLVSQTLFMVHDPSGYRLPPFLKVDCAALPVQAAAIYNCNLMSLAKL